MQLHLAKDITDLSTQAADFIVEHISNTLQRQPRFTIALSGGSTPKALHELLAGNAYKNKINWSKVHVFWGDERFVPLTDTRNNANMAFETLLDKVPVLKEHIHIMQTENITPDESAEAYQKLLHDYFPLVHLHHRDDLPDNSPHTTFDLIILGMGDDGHTLSLFPGKPVIHITDKWATAFYLDEQAMYRITLTHPVANHSACVLFLVSGFGKAKALKEVLEGPFNPDVYPSQIIKPKGELHWFVDEAAASALRQQ
jgi:6-phosphogluconolactonase